MKKGWKTKKLGEVCSFLNRGVSPKYVEKGGVVVLNQRCIRDHRVNFENSRRHDIKAKGISAERFVKGGDVLVNSTGEGTLGRVAQLREDPPEPTTVDSHVTIVRPAPGVFFTEFFGYVLRDIEEELKQSGEGCGGQTELNRAVLAGKFVVRFPESLAEQQRIVGLLDEAFEGLAAAKANAEKNLQNARALFESHLQSVFTQRGPGWPLRKLGELCDQITDGTHNSPTYVESGIPMLDSKHVQDDFSIDDSEPEKFISPATDALLAKRCKPRTGDILISSRGSIGKIAIVREGQDFNIMGNMILIRLPTGVNKAFAAFYLRSQLIHIESIARGVAQKGLYLNQIRNYEFPLPSETKQAQIGNQLDALSGVTQQLARLYERKLAALEALKKSLLHQAFTGAL